MPSEAESFTWEATPMNPDQVQTQADFLAAFNHAERKKRAAINETLKKCRVTVADLER